MLILPGHSYFGPFSSRQGGSAFCDWWFQWFWWHQTWFQRLSGPCTCVCMAVSSSDDTRHAFSGKAGSWQSWPLTLCLYGSGYLWWHQACCQGLSRPCACVCMAVENLDDTRHAFSGRAGPWQSWPCTLYCSRYLFHSQWLMIPDPVTCSPVFVLQPVILMIPGVLSAAEWALCLCLYGSQ